jgi:hypothetical protein
VDRLKKQNPAEIEQILLGQSYAEENDQRGHP